LYLTESQNECSLEGGSGEGMLADGPPAWPAQFELVTQTWLPDEATEHRNVGCPFYDDCLDAAERELRASESNGKGKRTGKHKAGRKRLGTERRTWICCSTCPARKMKDAYFIPLRYPFAEKP
jgi:hypothetical protein